MHSLKVWKRCEMPSFSDGNYGFVKKIFSKKVLLTADTKRQNASLDPKDFLRADRGAFGLARTCRFKW